MSGASSRESAAPGRSNPYGSSFAIRVDFLTRPALADSSRRGRGLEWPPHPHRLFAAMTAAHHEAGAGRRETLEWLERQNPPEISAPRIHERTRATVYVPVNDRKLTKGKGEEAILKAPTDRPLGDRRIRKPRTFSVGFPVPAPERRDGHQHTPPSESAPDHRSVYYTWHTAEPPPPDLDDILREVTRLGHSSSLVAASLWAFEPPPATLRPSAHGNTQLRVPEPGTLARLDELHAIRTAATKEQDRRKVALPPDAWIGYEEAGAAEPPRGPWREQWTWSLEPTISVTAWLHLAEAVRGALLRALPEDAPGVLDGHGRGNHLAVIPLPHVGHRHADAALLGFAVLAPELEDEVRDTLLLALGRLDEIGRRGRLHAGAAGAFRAEGVKADELRRTLRPRTWTEPAREWATVTPLVLDKFPKKNLPAEAIVARSVRRLGLPAPTGVRLLREGLHTGTPTSPEFRVRRARSATRHGPDHRPWSHAILQWDRPVEGPIVLGAMRHFGLGLCRPVTASPPGSPDDPDRAAGEGWE